MTAERRRSFEVEGVRLSAVIEGEGPSVLVLHGFTGDAESMASVAEFLADRFQVIRLELVGHGQSASPENRDAYSMEACIRQIRGVVEALGLPEAPHLLGYSMGGRAALSAAVAYPDFFARLVLVGATAGIADPALRAERIASDEALADRIERDGLPAFVDAWMALPIFASQARLGAEALAEAREQRLRGSITGLANSLRGMGAGAQPPIFDRLGRFPNPSLLVVGAADAKFQGIAERLAAELPKARIAVLPEAGHAAHLEAKESFAETVRAFLTEENEHE